MLFSSCDCFLYILYHKKRYWSRVFGKYAQFPSAKRRKAPSTAFFNTVEGALLGLVFCVFAEIYRVIDGLCSHELLFIDRKGNNELSAAEHSRTADGDTDESTVA